MTEPAQLIGSESSSNFIEEVKQRSEQNIYACYQCRRCASGCPIGQDAGNNTPDRLIRMILCAEKEQSLSNELVWKCLSCYTCGIRCPNGIQTARITETLKKMAKERELEPLNFKVAHFHSSFVSSGLRWGRVNEPEFMGSYELKNTIVNLKRKNFKAISTELASQLRFALSMLKLRRMHGGFLSAKGRKELKNLKQKHDKAQL